MDPCISVIYIFWHFWELTYYRYFYYKLTLDRWLGASNFFAINTALVRLTPFGLYLFKSWRIGIHLTLPMKHNQAPLLCKDSEDIASLWCTTHNPPPDKVVFFRAPCFRHATLSAGCTVCHGLCSALGLVLGIINAYIFILTGSPGAFRPYDNTGTFLSASPLK